MTMCQSGIKSVETSGLKEPVISDWLCSPLDDFDAVLVFLRILGNYFRLIFPSKSYYFQFESNCSPLSHFKPNYSFSTPVAFLLVETIITSCTKASLSKSILRVTKIAVYEFETLE